MPWGETTPMRQRVLFVADVARAADDFSTLRHPGGIIRRTGKSDWRRMTPANLARWRTPQRDATA
jgi:hypothetical protein